MVDLTQLFDPVMSRLPSCLGPPGGRAKQKPTGRPEVSLWNASCGVAPCPMKEAVPPGQGPGRLGRAGAREVLSPHPFLRTPPILSSGSKPVKAPFADSKSCKSFLKRNLQSLHFDYRPFASHGLIAGASVTRRPSIGSVDPSVEQNRGFAPKSPLQIQGIDAVDTTGSRGYSDRFP